MSKQVKRRELRKSLTADDEAYYTKADQLAILASLQRKTDSDAESFLAKVEVAATICVDWSDARSDHTTKLSDSKRRFERLELTLVKLIEDRAAIDVHHADDSNQSRRIARGQARTERYLKAIKDDQDSYEYLRTTSEELADYEGCLPNSKLEWVVSLDGSNRIVIWPVEEQIEKALETLNSLTWLRRVVAESKNRVELEMELAAEAAESRARPGMRQALVAKRRGGNRPDEPLHRRTQKRSRRARRQRGRLGSTPPDELTELVPVISLELVPE
jgi:hypothetical protein